MPRTFKDVNERDKLLKVAKKALVTAKRTKDSTILFDPEIDLLLHLISEKQLRIQKSRNAVGQSAGRPKRKR